MRRNFLKRIFHIHFWELQGERPVWWFQKQKPCKFICKKCGEQRKFDWDKRPFMYTIQRYRELNEQQQKTEK